MDARSRFFSVGVLILACLLCIPMSAQATDVSQDVKQMKQDLAQLRQELNELTNSVKDLVAAVKASSPQSLAEARKRIKTAGKKSLPKPEIQSAVCKAVDTYIQEIEKCLRLNDGVTAQARMERAYSVLKQAVNKYADLPAVSEILNVAADLDYNTYTDVSLRDSVEGTRGFGKSIRDEKRKLKAHCPDQ